MSDNKCYIRDPRHNPPFLLCTSHSLVRQTAPSVGLTLGQRRRRCPSVKPTLDERILFAVEAPTAVAF